MVSGSSQKLRRLRHKLMVVFRLARDTEQGRVYHQSGVPGSAESRWWESQEKLLADETAPISPYRESPRSSAGDAGRHTPRPPPPSPRRPSTLNLQFERPSPFEVVLAPPAEPPETESSFEQLDTIDRVAQLETAREMRPESVQTESPFFRLPGELRNEIYQLCLSLDTSSGYVAKDSPELEEVESQTQPVPVLMLTCKRIYREFSWHALTKASVRLSWEDLCLRTRVGYFGRMCWARLHTLHLIIDMEQPRYRTWLNFFERIVETAGDNLERLIIDWRCPVRKKVIRDTSWVNVELRRQEMEKMRAGLEREFLAVIAGIKMLKSVTFLGEARMEYWKNYLERKACAKVYGRWLYEPRALTP